jgi:hypothetical protein
MIAVVQRGFLYPVGIGTVGPHPDSFWPLCLAAHFSVVFTVRGVNDN